jgi:hypothetical protein
LATNLYKINGGAKILKSNLVNTKWDGDIVKSMLLYIKHIEPLPIPLSDFSPYKEDWDKNIVSWSTEKFIEYKTNDKKMTVIEAREKLAIEFENAMNRTGVTLIKAVTGIGKTELYLDRKNVTIALPTNRLKDEVSARMTEKGNKHRVTTEIPKFSDDVKEYIQILYDSGFNQKASEFIKLIAKGGINFKQEDIDLANEFINKNTFSNDTLITTHQRIMHMTPKHDTLIIDEDFMREFIKVMTIKVSDIQAVINLMDNKKAKVVLQQMLDSVLKSGNGYITKMPNYYNVNTELLFEAIHKTKSGNLLSEFIKCNAYTIDVTINANEIQFVKKYKLPTNYKRVIILSASASETLYRSYFGENLTFVDIMNVEPKGEIVQYPYYSCSRSTIDNVYEYLNKISVEENLSVITFKNKHFDKETDMYFGNTSGYNTLKGKDIMVVGTPHFPPYVYLLFAEAFNIEVDNSRISQRIIKRGRFEQKFFTFTNEWLRRVQLDMIEGELIQAIGRPRPLDNEVTVKLYSNLLMECSTQIDGENYTKKDKLSKVTKKKKEETFS